jgi:Xaa-Pro aminopeptidase
MKDARIEDNVIVTQTGIKALSCAAKDLLIAE